MPHTAPGPCGCAARIARGGEQAGCVRERRIASESRCGLGGGVRMKKNARMVCLIVALVATGLVAAWQALDVHYSFGGNWTALFVTGTRATPAELRAERLYVFPNAGYDGQFYHYIAHDPLLRRGFAADVDDPRLRYRRILVPGLAFLLALGEDGRIDRAYVAVAWLSIAAGAYWLGRFAMRYGYPAWLGLGFAIVPAVLITAERMTVDATLAACCTGFALYTEERAHWKLYAVLVAAGLVRETGWLLPVAYGIWLLGERRLRRAALFSTALLPAAIWYLFVALQTPAQEIDWFIPIPLLGIVARFVHPFPYPFGGTVRVVAIALDLLALVGIASALAWAAWRAWSHTWTPVAVAIYLFAMLAVVMYRDTWSEVYAFGRTLTPLALLAALDGLTLGSLLPTCALLAVDPRIGLAMGDQMLNVVRGVIG